MRNKRFCLIVTMLMIALVLVACSNDSDNSKDADGKVQLRLSTSTYAEAPHKQAIDNLLKIYNEKNPNVEIKIQGADYENFEDKLMTEIIAGNEADIIQFYPQNIATFHNLVEDGAFVELNSFIEEGNLKDKLIGQDLTQIDDTYLALSNYAWGNTGIFYKKSLFNKYEINPDDIETLEDFKEVANKLGEDGEQYGFASVVSSHPFVASEWYRLVARPVSNGVFFGNGEEGPHSAENINFASEKNIWAAEWWQDFLSNSNITPPGTIDKKVSREMFWNGDAAMVMDGPWFIGMTRERDVELIEDLGLIPQPNVEYEGEQYKPNPDNNPLVMAISKNSKYEKEAWEFMEWMTSIEAQEIIATSGMIPSNKDYADSDAYKEEYPLAYQFVEFENENYSDALMDPRIPQQGELHRIIVNAAEEMFISKENPTEVMNEAAKEMKQVMSK